MATAIADQVDESSSSPTVTSDRANQITVIRPRTGWQRLDMAELWRFRDLLWILSLRDIQIRYKQTALGALWAIIRPLVKMLIFTLFFGSALGVADKVEAAVGRPVPYAIFVFSGVLLWEFISASVSDAGMSLITNANIIRKIYLPRLFVPISAMGAPALDFLVGLTIMFALMGWYGEPFRWTLLLLPLCFLLAFIGTLGVALLIASWSVTYRDVKHMVPFTIQAWFFLTPVIYPVEIVNSHPWAYWLLMLNPASGAINGARACILGIPVDPVEMAVSTLVALTYFAAGLILFNSVERKFADVA